MEEPVETELSPSFDYDLEQNAHNLLVLDTVRQAEKEKTANLAEEQKRLLYTLRENRNEVLLDTSLLEKKILQEQVSIKNVFTVQDQIAQYYNGIKNQLLAAENNLAQLEAQSSIIEKLKETRNAEQSEYIKVAMEVENNAKLLKDGFQKIKMKHALRKEKKREVLKNMLEETAVNKNEAFQILEDLCTKELVNEKARITTPGWTLLEAVIKLRFAGTQSAEKNNTLKKLKIAKDSKIKSNNENVEKEKTEAENISRLVEELKATQKSNYEELTSLRKEKEEIVEILNTNSNNVVTNEQILEGKRKELENIEQEENTLFGEELSLKSKVTHIKNDMADNKSVMEQEMNSMNEKIKVAESECLLLRGRIFEISQQIELSKTLLEEKKTAYCKQQAEFKVLEDNYKMLKAANDLQIVDEEQKRSSFDEELAKLKLEAEDILAQSKNKESEIVALGEKLEYTKISIDSERKKKIIGEQEAVDTDKRILILRKEINELVAQETKLKIACSHLEQYHEILKDGESLREETRKKYDRLVKEIEDFDKDANTKIEEEKKKVIKVQEEVLRQKEDQTRLEQVIAYKTKAISQGEVEIMRLKELLREFDHNLAISIKEKEKLATELAKRNKKTAIVPPKTNRNPKRQVKTVPEFIPHTTNQKKTKYSEEFILSGSESQQSVTEIQATIKVEKPDVFDEIKREKKFFKSRASEPRRIPIYAQNNFKKPKNVDPQKTVFDYDDEEDISVVYVGKKL